MLSGLLLGSCLADDATTLERQRHVILNSRHLGAHGLGYNNDSLQALSRALTPADIPKLVNLAADEELRVGVQFALASQCEAAIFPVREAAVEHKMMFIDAEDIMQLIEDFDGCTPEARERAANMRSEIGTLAEIDAARLQKEAREKAAENARIQRNALKLTDPLQAKQLTREEREEIFHRSLKAMGLTENGPMTPAQKDLVDRMYRTMVLGESGNRPPN
jgi:hypothetical protein